MRFKRMSGLGMMLILLSQLLPIAWSESLTLEEGTSVDVQLQSVVSSETATEGEPVKLTVAFDVLAPNSRTVLIKAGTSVKGYVSLAENKDKMGEPGMVGVVVRSTKAVDGSQVPLFGSLKRSGKDKSSAMFWWGYWGMVQKGGDAVLSPGLIVKASTEQSVKIVIPSVSP